MNIPRILIGTTSLGNIYQVLPESQKLAIVGESVRSAPGRVFFDSAGKYGAGLALESLGKCLKELRVDPRDVMISNKLGWLRTSLKTPEPTFEPGIWFGLEHDAIQEISYDGILACFEQGNELLGDYMPQFLSVHDPDEYLASANSAEEHARKYNDILEAYRALHDLKKQGRAEAIGVGAKDWKTIQKIAADVKLDWVMFANSLTIYEHPPGLLQFITELEKSGIWVINSAVFNGGFLTGSDYFNYRPVSRDHEKDRHLYQWRDSFYAICKKNNILPAQACVQFIFKVPGVKSVALSSSSPKRTAENRALADAVIPDAFWQEMKEKGLTTY